MEIWGGIECTVNRVNCRFSDQLAQNGHCERTDDIDRIADLGITALRYPVLWETAAPDGPDKADWSRSERPLTRLRERGVRPIAGLVHHGSGPRYTSLVDPAFPEKLGAYARAVAEHFPWLEDYTPVNEPLTTARFSGLRGHWYPHGQSVRTFARVFLNEVRGTVLAMRAIRDVNPAARLIQTDDLAKIWSTPLLRYQADLENERRWITWDLLCGHVVPAHPMWDYLREGGASEAEIAWFAENPCPPDVIGVNYYLTSERFLDERVERYPGEPRGDNGRHDYADVAAVRVAAEGGAGLQELLTDVSARYGLPVAVTEAHLGCTREEQMRWLLYVWREAEAARRAGADIRAVTAWSVLGAHDWNSLVTVQAGYYEPGVFDVRGPAPRPTGIAHVVRALADGKEPDHPTLPVPGWWERPFRLMYPPVRIGSGPTRLPDRDGAPGARPLLITGAAGILGSAFARLCEERGLPYVALTRQDLDVSDAPAVAATLDALQPWAVVNAAGCGRPDAAEQDPVDCYQSITVGAVTLATACAERDIQLVTFSSDLVFDGAKGMPYVESDRPAPLGVYGRCQAEAEAGVLAVLPGALAVRTSALFGPWNGRDVVARALRAVAVGRSVAVPEDVYISPTYVPHLVHAVLDLLIDGEGGLWHLANGGAMPLAELARRAAEVAGLDPDLIEGCTAADIGLAGPPFGALESERGGVMPSLSEALVRFAWEGASLWTAPMPLPVRVGTRQAA
ncbi:MAG TPA: family 1 glycosylhydrolase [Rubricoccaceae bacterium]|jgi:dTDP-4-dehydrorhamnose reductase